MTTITTIAQQVEQDIINDPDAWWDIIEAADPTDEVSDTFGCHAGDQATFSDGSTIEYTPGSYQAWSACG